MDFLQRSQSERQNRLNTNIIIVGLCGSGKSTLGQHLARRLGFGFLDLDTWIEQTSRKTVKDIFNEEGEAAFRLKESQAIADIATICNHVIAVGGGAVASEENWQALTQLGATVWVHSTPAVIAHRLLKQPEELSKRPLLADIPETPDEASRFEAVVRRLELLMQQRQSWFERAQFVVHESFAPPDDCARRLKNLLESKQASKILKNAKKPENQPQR